MVSTRESTWDEMGKKCPKIIANETLYQLRPPRKKAKLHPVTGGGKSARGCS